MQKQQQIKAMQKYSWQMERKRLHWSEIPCYFILALFFACFILLLYHQLALTDHRYYVVSLNSHLPQKLERKYSSCKCSSFQSLRQREVSQDVISGSHFYRHTHLCALWASMVRGCSKLLHSSFPVPATWALDNQQVSIQVLGTLIFGGSGDLTGISFFPDEEV